MLVNAIDPDECRVITFDFSPDLASGEVLTGVIKTTVTMAAGADDVPTSILNGTSAFDSTFKKVLVPIKGGILGRDYAIKVIVGTNNVHKVMALVAHLPIRQDVS